MNEPDAYFLAEKLMKKKYSKNKIIKYHDDGIKILRIDHDSKDDLCLSFAIDPYPEFTISFGDFWHTHYSIYEMCEKTSIKEIKLIFKRCSSFLDDIIAKKCDLAVYIDDDGNTGYYMKNTDQKIGKQRRLFKKRRRLLISILFVITLIFLLFDLFFSLSFLARF